MNKLEKVMLGSSPYYAIVVNSVASLNEKSLVLK